jgi:carbon-monoxide dehydrogenase medium subunit/xanthine dehydrogenase FAD-binding subunit
MKLDEFLAGEGFSKRNIMEADEMLTEVSFKLPDERTATGFYKLAKRKSLAISVIGAGMVVSVDENGVCTYARLRAGALGRYPMPFEAFEQHLVGKKLTMETVKAGLPLMGEHVMNVNKGRASAIYKKDAVQGAYEHLFEDALAELGL